MAKTDFIMTWLILYALLSDFFSSSWCYGLAARCYCDTPWTYHLPFARYNASSTYTEVPFLDLHLSISYDFVSSKLYDKRADFDIVNFPFLAGDIPRATFYWVFMIYISARLLCENH